MWRAAALTLVSACSSVLGIDDLSESCFRDDFESGVIDPNVWVQLDPASPVTMVIDNGGLLIAPPPMIMAENGISTITPIDISDGAVEVEVITSALPNNTETFLLVFLAPDTGYGLIASEGQLIGRAFVDGNNSPDQSIPFDPALRFWRIRHDGARHVVALEASPDGIEYAQVRVLPGQPPPTSVTPRLQAGLFNAAQPEPARALFEGIETFNATCL